MRWVDRSIAAAAALVLVADVTVVLTKAAEPSLAWDPRVLPLVSFVEKERGLRFTHPVPVSFLDDAAFEKQVAPPEQESAKDKKDLADFVGSFRALGLLRGPLDLRAAYDDLTRASIIGLYVSEDRAVYVRGTQLSPSVRVTLVHELTHVVQDQHFGLDKLRDDAPGGDTTAVTALVEGDAVRIEEAYRDSLSKADLTAYTQEQQQGFASSQTRTSDVPAVLSDFLGFPYVFGPVLLDSLAAKSGNAGVDRAFRHPPTSEAQVLDPVTYPFDVDPVTVPLPSIPLNGTAFGDPGPFGQVFLFDVLGSQLGYQDAWAAVQGWVGDSFTGYRRDGAVCAAADVRMRNAAATDRLAAASRRWAARVPGAQVSVDGQTVALRSCDPGSAGHPLPKQDPSAFDVLVVRTQVLHEVTRSGTSYPVARCVADAVVADGRSDGYHDLTDDDPSEAAIKRFQEVAGAAFARCNTVNG